MIDPYPGPSPRERRHKQTERAILDAALGLIAERGIGNLTLREIARTVHYSAAALYEYFDSKEAIVQVLAREGDGLLRKHLEQVPKDLPPDERLVGLGLAYIDFACRHQEHFRLMFNELRTRRTSLSDPVKEDAPYSLVVNAVQEGLEQNVFKARPDYGKEAIAYGLWALAHGAATLQLTKLAAFQEDFMPSDRRTFETFLRGLRTP